MKKLTYKHTLISCFAAYFSEAVVNNLAPLFFVIFQNRFGLTYSQLAALAFINFFTQLVTDVVAAKVSEKTGIRNSMALGHIFLSAGLIAMSLMPHNFVCFAFSIMIYSVGCGFCEVIVIPIGDALPSEAKSNKMSLLHSFYCWGQVCTILVTTLLLSLLGENSWSYIPLLWAVIPALNLIYIFRMPIPESVLSNNKINFSELFRSKTFIIVILLMACSGASEVSVSQWASLFAEKGLKITKAFGDILGPCLFAVFMGIGRAGYGLFGKKLRLERLLVLCAVIIIVCSTTIVLSPVPIVSLLACAFSGFGVSLLWPGFLSLSSKHYPGGGTGMFAVLALGGDIGCSLGPWLVGELSAAAEKSDVIINFAAKYEKDISQIILKCGMSVTILFPVIMLVGLYLFKASLRKSERSPFDKLY